jgi:HAD superfamily hydrolase (TIGR01509 family)
MKISRNFALTLLATCIAYLAVSYVITDRSKTKQIKSLQRFHAIIFDMDGTTIDTDHMWKSANGPILNSHAPHLTQEEKDAIIAKFPHLTIYEIWKLIHENCSVEITPDQIIDENIQHLHSLYEQETISFIPHFSSFHEKVVGHGLKTAIASNSQQHTINVIVKTVPLHNYFGQHIYNADHVNKVYKPQPDIYLHAAKMLGVEPCHCIAIEDSGSGIKAAKAAGMYCIGINTGKNRAALAQADEIVDCYTHIDLEKLLSLEN